MKNIIYHFTLLAIIYSNIAAQNTGTLRGLVTDSTTSEALAYCNVFLKELGIGTASDSRGYFLIPSIPANQNFTLIISYIGYHTKKINIKISPNKITHYDVQLLPSEIELQAIEKVEKLVEESRTDISIRRILSRDLEYLPKGVESDLFRSLKYLSGVQSTGDVSARFYVRGGASNQNLILVDGITLYNPFHALGLFSVIDPDVINNIEFYKGGFAANYGGRISSVVDIKTNDGNKNRFGAKASASYLSTKLFLEGPLPHGSFFLSGRKSYSTEILKKFLDNQNVPADFYDLSFKMNYSNQDFIPGSKFIVNGFFSSDKIDNPDPTIEDFGWKNNLFGFRWFFVGDIPLFLELGLSLSNFQGEVLPQLSSLSKSRNEINDISMKMDLTYIFNSKDELGVGFHINQINTNLFIENRIDEDTDINNKGTDISLYTKYKILRFDNFAIDAGLRFNLASVSPNKEKIFIEPRLNAFYTFWNFLTVKGAWGIYQQTLTTVSDEDEIINIFEPWIITPAYLPPAKAMHAIFGVEFDNGNFWKFGVESYYKTVNNLPVLNKDKIYATDNDFKAGEGESYGLEVNASITTSSVKLTTSYTHAYAYKVIDGKRYYPRYDTRHNFNVMLDIDFGNSWHTSIIWVYSSGLPFTEILGYYDKLYLDNFFDSWNYNDPRKPYTLIGIQNLGRLPDYHRLDLNISKKFIFPFMNLYLDFNIVNLYDRANIFYFKKDTGERVNMLPFLPTFSLKVEL
ncbi:TonB-dependent receptor [Melioribacter sp. OK-6-Me]|uniref:TonB-dependent receptor n=1 Tax=unclassified Melioribacter TaxID=2627329 RepID=UPI003EDA8189